ncbi:SDR family NAD(P)-dependent oxidoreductase [Chloroflexota bacterium]
MQTAVDSFGKVDILVNNVGTFGFSPIWKMTEELWDHVTIAKPKSHFNCIRHAAPIMMEQKWGRILNCTSRAFLGDTIRHAEYCAANAGVVGLTRAAAIELYPYGITCNAYSPFARTRASFELMAYSMAVDEEDKPFLSSGGPSMKLEDTPSPDYIVPFLVYLASEAAANISGSVFNVGGNSIGMYSQPDIARSLYKEGDPWTMDELSSQAPRALFRGYKSPAAPPIF